MEGFDLNGKPIELNTQPEWRQELKRIVDFLNRKDEDSQKLWWVLTALRGPDTAGDEFKRATTSVIRNEIGLKAGVGNGATVYRDDPSFSVLRKKYFAYGAEPSEKYWEQTHFRIHIQEAFEALGLNLEDLNHQEEPHY